METVKKRGRTGYTKEARARRSDDCSESNLELELTPDQANNGKKIVRGKTTLQVIPTGESNRQSVEWNERGQPVGDFSKRFSSTIGVLVRESVPINIQTWHAVDDVTKNSVWGLLMQKYVVDLSHKTLILQQMGRLWRAWKSDLSTNIRRTVDTRRTKSETTRLLNMFKPTDVPQKEWDEFVAERNSESWQSGQDSTQLSINDKCKLLNWEGTSEVVAKGHISDIHPESKVHGYKLGPDCYRIAIEEVVMPDASFYRSQSEFVSMDEALGSTVAWPIKYILCDN